MVAIVTIQLQGSIGIDIGRRNRHTTSLKVISPRQRQPFTFKSASLQLKIKLNGNLRNEQKKRRKQKTSSAVRFGKEIIIETSTRSSL